MKKLFFTCLLFSMPTILFSSQQKNKTAFNPQLGINNTRHKKICYNKNVPLNRRSGHSQLLAQKEQQKSQDAQAAQKQFKYNSAQKTVVTPQNPVPGSPEYAQEKLNSIAQRNR